MSLSMYQASVPVFLQQFAALSAILEKGRLHAEAAGLDPLALIATRLAPDMFPLDRQVQIATDGAKGGIARLAGITAPSFADDEKTFADLEARIAKTVAFLKTITPAQIDGTEDKAITLHIGDSDMSFLGQPYLLHFVLPNFFFHVTSAYAILRHAGVVIGKRDFLGAIVLSRSRRARAVAIAGRIEVLSFCLAAIKLQVDVFENGAIILQVRHAQRAGAGAVDAAFPYLQFRFADAVARLGFGACQHAVADRGNDLGLAADYPAHGVRRRQLVDRHLRGGLLPGVR